MNSYRKQALLEFYILCQVFFHAILRNYGWQYQVVSNTSSRVRLPWFNSKHFQAQAVCFGEDVKYAAPQSFPLQDEKSNRFYILDLSPVLNNLCKPISAVPVIHEMLNYY